MGARGEMVTEWVKKLKGNIVNDIVINLQGAKGLLELVG